MSVVSSQIEVEIKLQERLIRIQAVCGAAVSDKEENEITLEEIQI